MLRLHDTALGQVVDLDLREDGKVAMYTCGPTPYDEPHLGHGRHILVFDVLRRYLMWSGFDVRYISNVTDIEDKIIARALREDRSTEDVVAEAEQQWWDAVDALGALRPDEVPRATEYVERMVGYIERLVEREMAYESDDGVYFSVEAMPGYGLLARQPLESLRAGARVEVDERKRSPMDFALWKKSKPGEPSWPSPWGAGRPGWHIECTVMSLGLLGPGYDLHGAGDDLCFPHNENERAQAVAGGDEYVRHWIHHGMVVMAGGEKMSKSAKDAGHFTSLTALLAQTDPRAYRLLVLQSRYRSPLEVTAPTIDRAERTLAGLDEFAARTRELPDVEPIAEKVEAFRLRMDDDLDTPGAMAVVFDSLREGNAALDAGDTGTAAAHAATVRELLEAVGLPIGRADAEVDEPTRSLVDQRDAARAAKDWARADALRDELAEMGWVVKDTPEGTRVHRR